MTAEQAKLIEHIQARVAKSATPSPEIFISRDGWALIVEALKAHARLEQLQRIERAARDTHSDLLLRAEINRHLNGGAVVVEMSDGRWKALCEALGVE